MHQTGKWNGSIRKSEPSWFQHVCRFRKKWRELSELSDAEKEKLKPKIFEHTEAAIDVHT